MPTKTKIINNNRGRPKKEFKLNPKITTEEKRSRGRPKKDKKIKESDSINTRISKHGKDIKVMSKKHDKICFEIKNSSFASKKIPEDNNTNSDKFALWLLVFSMLLFIFSMYKTFYLNTGGLNTDNLIFEEINTEEVGVEKPVISAEIAKKTVIVEEDIKDVEDKKTPEVEIVTKDSDDDIIKTFYDKLNNRKYSELPDFADNYMKYSSMFKIYYTENWFWNFLDNLTNGKVYLTNLEEIIWETDKVWVKYYSYTIKYKLKNNNEMFEEQWKAAIINRNDIQLIGSMQCTNVWCSKMPFFNPEKHGIK